MASTTGHTYLVDVGGFSLKHGTIFNKTASGGRGGKTKAAAAQNNAQPSVSTCPTFCLDNYGQLDAKKVQQQVGYLMTGSLDNLEESSGLYSNLVGSSVGGGTATSTSTTAGGGTSGGGGGGESSSHHHQPLDAKETSLVLSIDPETQRTTKEQIIADCFEDLGVASLYLCYSPVSALFATGGTTGTVVDMGHFRSRICPVREGMIVREHFSSSSVGGYAQSMHLQSVVLASHQLDSSEVVVGKKRKDGGQQSLSRGFTSHSLHLAKVAKAVLPSGASTSSKKEEAAGQQGLLTQGNNVPEEQESNSSFTLALPDGSPVEVKIGSELSSELGEVLTNPASVVGAAHRGGGGLQASSTDTNLLHLRLFQDQPAMHTLTANTLAALRAGGEGTAAVAESYLLCGGASSTNGYSDFFKASMSKAFPKNPNRQLLGGAAAAAGGNVGGGGEIAINQILQEVAVSTGVASRPPKQRVATDKTTCSWQGSALFCQLSSFHSTFKVSRRTYADEGPGGVIPLFHIDQL